MANEFDINFSTNGDTAVGFTSSKKIKALGWMDKAELSDFMLEDDGKQHIKHLGLINLFETTHKTPMTFMKDLFQGAQVLEVEEGQSIRYDLPVEREDYKCYTMEDTSGLHEFPGIDETYFEIVLSTEFTAGDILTYDFQFGDEVMVSSEHPVTQSGETYRHVVSLNASDGKQYFPKEWLKAGIQWMKKTNALAEFDTSFSTITLAGNPLGTVTNEFLLGSPRGVETFATAKAFNAKSQTLTNTANQMRQEVSREMEQMGNKDMMFTGYSGDGKSMDQSSMKVGTVLEYLAMMEITKMENQSLIFSKAGTFQSSNGVRRINEGIWHQIRRGKIITYSKPGGITMNHIREAVQYIYRNTDVPVGDRRVEFKSGYFADLNLQHLFREFAITQLNQLPTGMLGTDAQVPAVFSGSLDSLKMARVVIAEVFIPGVGIVSANHDPSLDYQPMSDRFAQGMYGNGYAHTAHSLVIWDLTDKSISNVSKRVKNASLVDGGNSRANIYYVKPEGNHLTYGYEQGRMANRDKNTDVQSSLKQMARTFWCTSQSAALLLDVTRYVVIELERITNQ